MQYEALKLLLNVPSIDVNIVDKHAYSAVHRTVVCGDNIEGLKLLLSHPSLTTLTLNQRERLYGDTPVMLAVKQNSSKHLKVLAADPRVDLDTTDMEGRSLEEVATWWPLARWVFLLHSCFLILSITFIGHHHYLSVASAQSCIISIFFTQRKIWLKNLP